MNAAAAELVARVRSCRDGEVVRVSDPGVYAGFSVKFRTRLGFIFSPGVIFDGEDAADYGMRISDGAGLVTLEGPAVFRNYRKNSIFITRGEGFRLIGAKVYGCGKTGVQTGIRSRVYIEDLEATDNGGHGLYLSAGGDDLTVTRSSLHDNAKCGCQINAAPRRSTGVKVFKNKLWGNENAGLQLCAVSKAVIAENEIHENRQGIVIWSENRRAKACHDIDLTRQESGEIDVDRFSTGVRLPRGRD